MTEDQAARDMRSLSRDERDRLIIYGTLARKVVDVRSMYRGNRAAQRQEGILE